MVNKQKKNNLKNGLDFFKSLFSYFNLKKSTRVNAEKPKNLMTWVVHGISELIGTILISLLLAGLSTVISAKGGKAIIIEHYLIHPSLVGLYAGFIAVGLVLFIFLRWSCDLNPAVSLTRYLNGTNDGWYTSYKILIQFIGALIAGLIIYAVGNGATNGEFVSNLPINSISAADKVFPPFKQATLDSKLVSGSIWIVFVEISMTVILLMPIFSPRIEGKYRDTFIMAIISFSVWMGVLSGTAAINPARGLAQQLPILIFESSKSSEGFLAYTQLVTNDASNVSQVWNGVVSGTISMLLGGFMAPFVYLFIQGFTEKVFNPFVTKVIAFKNFKSQNMQKPYNNDKK
ncbi:aquaporin [Mycoplasmopsis edwardii]|uniref:Aquaporin n=1 Tax=Mycoplasmopsis edwardii TaxID=53558 RepID=A0ACD4PGP8_9BACT|nr:aquaporin [Mycoplasmopsis edwardii]WBP83829.1 aquaporin [Mycoplasmopsis edwardii]